MVYDIKGKNALVTGGASGIGLWFVKELLKSGANKVFVLYLHTENAGDISKQLNIEYGRECTCFQKVDVSNATQLENAFKTCINWCEQLDIVINNAGVMNDGKWEMEIAININAVVRGTKLAFQYMGKDKGGKGGIVVNLSSILGLQPLAGCPIYVATKHALIGMDRSWGTPFHYNRTGIKVLTMCPGVTDTPLISEAHGLQGDDILGRECQRELDAMPTQSPAHVAQSMMAMITKGETGSVWICEGGQPIYEVEIPDRLTLKRKN
ncbi:15-hydroxyprostaglandin dehydrogenase [NAD(+)]-like [Chrysoperla carnea]|uniref:15-hydroxyprostaglandin dehydrogenase [NAD(+)]-like n=1 Tax=Chrysoperla carnea TaxID=189513 RepID=UPI001D06428A|nr:15-hydroxyprostaglandin dehydrogenase [NAD(+)]-like [Chrysoperla carnea]